MDNRARYSPEVQERAVRLVREQAPAYPSQWAAIRSIAGKVGCTAEAPPVGALRGPGCRRAGPGLTTAEQQRVKELERENRELRRVNEIPRKASAHHVQAALDCRGTR